MKAALLRSSGDGESEKWWKRLSGWRRTLPDNGGGDVLASPG